MKWVIIFAALVQTVIFVSAQYSSPMTEETRKTVTANNKFGLDLYKALMVKEGNLFFSPISLATCLSMVYFMAGGNTANEILKTLYLSPNQNVTGKGIHTVLQALNTDSLSCTNNGFIETTISLKPSYVDILQEYFGIELEKVNFKEDTERARLFINNWVANKTGDKFTELLNSDAVSPETRLVLISTINFEGIWHYAFRPESTREENFNLADATAKKVAMMTGRGHFGFRSFEELDANIVQIPYKDYELSMVIILPNTANGLLKLEKEVSKLNFIDDIIDKLRNTTVEVVIPKFKLEISYELKENLKQLGINDAFNSQYSDFSNGLENTGLEVSSVVHKTYIAVDEEGTLAAATSGALVNERADIEDLFPVVIADHPFLFSIIDNKTKSILFLGRYVSPP